MTIKELQELVRMIKAEKVGILRLVVEAESIPVIEYLMDRDFEVWKRLRDAEVELAAVSF